jgi:biopolymer transport protein ExbD
MKIKRRHLEAGAPVVAMADIAFNLVLFFIILARTQDDSDLQWEPARGTHLESISLSKVSVTVNKEGKVYLNHHPINLTEIAPKIQELLGNEEQGKRTVLLKIHKDTQAAVFEPIIEAVSQAGGDVVHVLAEEVK